MTRPVYAPARPVLHCRTRWAIRRDMPSVLAIDADTAAHGGRPAWGEAAILAHLRQRQGIGMVAVAPGEIVAGFMLYTMHRDCIEIADFAVAPHLRRHLVGWQMMDRLAGKLDGERRTRIEWAVRETCLDAQLFAKARGFVARFVDRGAFRDTGEDAYFMIYSAHGAPVTVRGEGERGEGR